MHLGKWVDLKHKHYQSKCVCGSVKDAADALQRPWEAARLLVGGLPDISIIIISVPLSVFRVAASVGTVMTKEAIKFITCA